MRFIGIQNSTFGCQNNPDYEDIRKLKYGYL